MKQVITIDERDLKMFHFVMSKGMDAVKIQYLSGVLEEIQFNKLVSVFTKYSEQFNAVIKNTNKRK